MALRMTYVPVTWPPMARPGGARGGGRRCESEQRQLPVLRLLPRDLARLLAQQLALDVGEKARRRLLAHAAAQDAALGAAEQQPVLCARHADVEQTALLGERRRV